MSYKVMQKKAWWNKVIKVRSQNLAQTVEGGILVATYGL